MALLVAVILASIAVTDEVVYANNFDGKPGSTYPEWSSSTIAFEGPILLTGKGTLPAEKVTNVESPKGNIRFLGEFGGPRIDRTARTRVRQSIRLSLKDLKPHDTITLEFDLLILKSWDGNSPIYGPDRWKLRVEGGPTLLDTTFSNNPKTEKEGTFQDYPKPGSQPFTGAVSTRTLGYQFFGDSLYKLSYTFPHHGETLALIFSSDLFEGKGIADESWGLDHVVVTAKSIQLTPSTPAPKRQQPSR